MAPPYPFIQAIRKYSFVFSFGWRVTIFILIFWTINITLLDHGQELPVWFNLIVGLYGVFEIGKWSLYEIEKIAEVEHEIGGNDDE